MKIELSVTPEDYQKAMKLRLLFEHMHSSETDPDMRNFIEYLIQQIDDYLASPELQEQLKLDERDVFKLAPRSFLRVLRSFLQSVFGPSNRELVLSKQRRELIGRAEHAENIAFQALAESTDLKKNLEDALQKLRALEKQIEQSGSSGKS